MKTRSWFVLAGVMIAVVAVLALVPATFAQGPQDGTGPFGRGYGMMGGRMGGYGMEQGAFGRGFGMGPGRGMGLGIGGPEESLVAVAAEQVGLDRTELIAELQSGKTLAEVITTHGGDPAKVVESFLAERQADLAELVASGQISQEQADSLLATMRANAPARLEQGWIGRGNGQGFVDQDGDGVCDYAGTGRGGRGQ